MDSWWWEERGIFRWSPCLHCSKWMVIFVFGEPQKKSTIRTTWFQQSSVVVVSFWCWLTDQVFSWSFHHQYWKLQVNISTYSVIKTITITSKLLANLLIPGWLCTQIHSWKDLYQRNNEFMNIFPEYIYEYIAKPKHIWIVRCLEERMKSDLHS